MKRSKIKIMLSLGAIAKPLLYIMIPAVLMGVAGDLCAEFITVLGGYGSVNILGFETAFSLKKTCHFWNYCSSARRSPLCGAVF